MVFLLVFAGLIFLWPRFILYFMAAPFLGAILGGFVWAMSMFASGCTMPLSSIGTYVLGGMGVSTTYAVFWANKEKL